MTARASAFMATIEGLGASRARSGVLPADVGLTRVRTRAYPLGFVQSTYRPLRPEPA